MDKETFEKAKDLQSKITTYKATIADWNGGYKDKALQFCGKNIENAVSKLFAEKVTERINQLQKQFKEL